MLAYMYMCVYMQACMYAYIVYILSYAGVKFDTQISMTMHGCGKLFHYGIFCKFIIYNEEGNGLTNILTILTGMTVGWMTQTIWVTFWWVKCVSSTN